MDDTSLDRHYSSLLDYARRYTVDGNRADDIAQAAYLKVYTYLRNNPDHDIRDPVAWLKTVTRSAVFDQYRLESRIRDHEMSVADTGNFVDPDAIDPIDVLAVRENANYMYDYITSALDLLPDIDRDLLHDFYYRGRSIQQLAASLYATPGAIKVRLHRARDRLRTILADETE